MENNFIRMAALAGLAVAYMIESIFKHIIVCVARSAVLLKPNVANILLFNFCEEKFVEQAPLTVTTSPCSFSKKNGPILPLDQNPQSK